MQTTFMPIEQQVREGRLVSPKSHQQLQLQASELTSADRSEIFPVLSSVPILLTNPEAMTQYAQASQKMLT